MVPVLALGSTLRRKVGRVDGFACHAGALVNVIVGRVVLIERVQSVWIVPWAGARDDDHSTHSALGALGFAAEAGDRLDAVLRHTQPADLLIRQAGRPQVVPDPFGGLTVGQAERVHQVPVDAVAFLVEVAARLLVRELASGPVDFLVEVGLQVAHGRKAFRSPASTSSMKRNSHRPIRLMLSRSLGRLTWVPVARGPFARSSRYRG